MRQEEVKNLTAKQKLFCEKYILDWNATRSYLSVYKVKSESVAASAAARMLTNVKIQHYISELQDDLEKVARVSRLKVLEELKTIAFSNISSFYETWLERKDFKNIPDDAKKSIQEISTKILKQNIGTKEEPEIVGVEHVKIKLHDKLAAIQAINKMLGYDKPQLIDIKSGGKTIQSQQPTTVIFRDYSGKGE